MLQNIAASATPRYNPISYRLPFPPIQRHEGSLLIAAIEASASGKSSSSAPKLSSSCLSVTSGGAPAPCSSSELISSSTYPSTSRTQRQTVLLLVVHFGACASTIFICLASALGSPLVSHSRTGRTLRRPRPMAPHTLEHNFQSVGAIFEEQVRCGIAMW
jgi:hypothetical protein